MLKKKIWPLIIIAICSIAVNGQTLLDQKVSLFCDNLPLENALFQLIDQSDIALSFSNKIIPSDKLISCTFADQPLRSVLEFLLGGTSLTFKEVGLQVIIIRNQPSLQQYTLSGFVRDQDSGENIVGAVIFDNSLEIGTYTNEFGFYSITFTEGTFYLFEPWI